LSSCHATPDDPEVAPVVLPSVFILPQGPVDSALLEALAPDLTLESETPRSVRLRHFDTFDWRLHRAERALLRQDGTWRLTDLSGRQVIAEAPARSGPWPRYAVDFAAYPELHRLLRKRLKMRALIHLVTARLEQTRWAARNHDGKIVLRLALGEVVAEKPTAAGSLRLLEIEELRGYEKHARLARQKASRRGLTAQARPLLDALLALVGLEPRSYSSKFRAELTADQPSLEAFAIIGRTLLHTLRQNEVGLRADIDTEFLHDFRVAVRRQRSALASFKGVVDAEAVAFFAAELRALGRLTGPLRDLDVYLLDRERYLAQIPADLRGGLVRRFDRLEASREQELTRVRRALSSPEYGDLVRMWSDLMDAPPAGPLAATPIVQLAGERLRKRHQRVIRDGRAIGRKTPDEALHRLRIQCKKLRYLLEFAAPIFGEDAIADLVSHLKGLQDNLGEFNDLSVQQEDLRQALDAIPGRSRSSLQEAAAIGGLLTALVARQRVVRGEFAAAFADFAERSVADRFAALVGSRRASG
jgi:CHAD domain-containing protein